MHAGGEGGGGPVRAAGGGGAQILKLDCERIADRLQGHKAQSVGQFVGVHQAAASCDELHKATEWLLQLHDPLALPPVCMCVVQHWDATCAHT